MFNRIKKWIFKIEENRRLRAEIARLEERNEMLRMSLETFSDSTVWHEYYPLDEDVVVAWQGCNKPWLAAERAILEDIVLSGDDVPNDQTRLENVIEEFYAYREPTR